jgi:hypothetical protein
MFDHSTTHVLEYLLPCFLTVEAVLLLWVLLLLLRWQAGVADTEEAHKAPTLRSHRCYPARRKWQLC